MNFPFLPYQLIVDRLKIAAWIALVSFGSMAFLHAETAVKKVNSVPAPLATNAVAAPSAAPASAASSTSGSATNSTNQTAPSFSLKIGSDAETETDSTTKSDNDDPDRADHWTAEGLAEVMIPICGILATFGTPVLIVYFVCAYKYRRRQDDMAVVRDCISKGLPVPPQLLNESWGTSSSKDPVAVKPITRGRSDIRRGIKYAAVGLGVSLALFVHNPHSTTWAWGLIVLVMGLGFLLSGWIETRPQPGDGNLSPNPPPLDGPR